MLKTTPRCVSAAPSTTLPAASRTALAKSPAAPAFLGGDAVTGVSAGELLSQVALLCTEAVLLLRLKVGAFHGTHGTDFRDRWGHTCSAAKATGPLPSSEPHRPLCRL